MATILKILDEPSSPTIEVMIDVGNLQAATVSVPRAVYGTDAMTAMLERAAANARDPSAVQYAAKRALREQP
jgi:hypothetical protein